MPPDYEKQELRERVTELEQGIRNFLAGDYPNPRKYRPHECPHKRNYWEDCCQCNDEYFEKLLGKPLAAKESDAQPTKES